MWMISLLVEMMKGRNKGWAIVLPKNLKLKLLGKLNYFSKVEIAHSKIGIFASQKKYITDLLQETSKIVCKPTNTLVNLNSKLWSAEDDVALDKEVLDTKETQSNFTIILHHLL